jgi:glutamate-5-semialdehyde dehydrogenase
MKRTPSFTGARPLEAEMHAMGERARVAAVVLREASTESKNDALLAASNAIRADKDKILAANDEDMRAGEARGLSPALLDRLRLDGKRVEAMVQGAAAVAALPDPVGRELARWKRPNGLDIARVATPIGVLAIIYESRPNVTADAGALCLKSGNAVILRGGSESAESSIAIHAALIEGLRQANLPEAAIQMVPTIDRAAVGMIFAGLSGAVDLIVPRGGRSLVARVQAEARVPVLAHLEGICHTYVHAQADLAKARALVLNGKMRRTGICGATETLLIDRSILSSHLVPILDDLARAGCQIGHGGGLAHRISRRHHRGARSERGGRGDPAHRDPRFAAHRMHRHRG